jgi:beta-glucanase (GH16 family)
LAPALLLLWLATSLCFADRNLNHLGYTLTWHDDFDGPNVDTNKWNISVGYTDNGNGELEYYSTGNVYITNGLLVLESDETLNNGQTGYTSGKVTSAGKFDQLYGWFEWSGQIPAGQGFWPAYWMLNYVAWPPEMDVMETIGTSVECNTMSLHWGPLPAGCIYPWDCGHTENATYCGPDFSAGFHTFAVDWEPSGSVFYVDGVPRETAGYLGNCTNTMYLIMNTAVGGDWPGSPDSSTPFPAYNLIDYVHVFKPLAGRYSLLNPSFEIGEAVNDFNDWNTYDSGNIESDPIPANARSGNRAVQVWGRYNGQDNTTGIYQDLWAFGGEGWQASVWARNRPGDVPQGGNAANLKLEFWDNFGNLLSRTMQTILTNGSPTNYSQYCVSSVAPFSASRARIVMEYYQTADGAGSVNFDDPSLDLLWPQPNVLTNGSFESGLSGWIAYGASWTNYLVACDVNTALSGTNYFMVWGQYSGAENFSGVYQDVRCSPGAAYAAQGGAYTSSGDTIGAGNTAWIEVTFRDAATNILALYRSALLDSTMAENVWQELAVTNQYDPNTDELTGAASSLVAPAGTQFVRYQVLFYQPASDPGGSVYFDQLSLTKAGLAAPPAITTVSPDGSMPFLSAASAFAFTVSSPSGLASNSVECLVNGLDVSSQLVCSGPSNILNFTLPGLAPNALYTMTISATNAAGIAATNLSFDTFNQTNLTIEAEDFDFSGGQFFDHPTPGSALATDSYFGRVGTVLVDENYVTYAGSHLYRSADDMATEVTSDFLRQKYFAAQITNAAAEDYDVGWWYPGAWMNYTRTFPAGNYCIYARLAGGDGNYRVSLEQVTSGRGTTSQTTRLLGYLNGAGGGWQDWTWVPLQATNGQNAVVSLGGISTLRAMTSGNANANFFLLVPAPSPLQLLATQSATGVSVSVPTEAGFSYVVLYKNDLTDASWKVLRILSGDGSTQRLIDTAGQARRFYKVLVE